MINNQNKSKVFLLIIAILVIANIAMLSFFLQKKETKPRVDKPDRKTVISNFLKNEIGFNQSQLIQYDTLSNRQRDKMKSLFEDMRNNKNSQLKQLAPGNFSDSIINVVADQAVVSQKMMNIQMSNHIKSVRELCTPEQLPKFDSLFIKAFSKWGDGRKKPENKN